MLPSKGALFNQNESRWKPAEPFNLDAAYTYILEMVLYVIAPDL